MRPKSITVRTPRSKTSGPLSADHLRYGLMPGPLFRQLALLAYAAGIFSLRAPLPSVVCILLVAGLGKIRSKTALLLLAAAFGLGVTAAWVRLPTIPEVPQWVAERPKVQITGTVHEQKGLPDNRLRMVLSNVQCTLPQGETTALPGLLVWTWQYPAAPRPAKGQIVSFRAMVMPIRGFVNPEGWDTRFYWRCKGAFFRTYTRGEKNARHGARYAGEPTGPRLPQPPAPNHTPGSGLSGPCVAAGPADRRPERSVRIHS